MPSVLRVIWQRRRYYWKFSKLLSVQWNNSHPHDKLANLIKAWCIWLELTTMWNSPVNHRWVKCALVQAFILHPRIRLCCGDRRSDIHTSTFIRSTDTQAHSYFRTTHNGVFNSMFRLFIARPRFRLRSHHETECASHRRHSLRSAESGQGVYAVNTH